MLFAVAGIIGLAFGSAAPRAHAHARHEMTMEAGGPTHASLYDLDSKWTTQDGGSVALGSFVGKPLVAAMRYTTCKEICPAAIADMMWIDRHLPPGAAGPGEIRLLQLDSAADTPERLKLDADGHGLDLSRWTPLRADDDAARELAAALGVGYRPDGQGGFDRAVVISLLDERGEMAPMGGHARALAAA
jgi:protein SCO1/2